VKWVKKMEIRFEGVGEAGESDEGSERGKSGRW
jgi:hypothetical protein